MYFKIFILLFLFTNTFAATFLNRRKDIFNGNTIVPQLDSRIVGGWTTNITEHPYQASLRRSDIHICGASLISPRWLLTSAHCLTGIASEYSVRLGSSLWREGGIVDNVSEIILHPLFNLTTIDYDIALVQLINYQNDTGDIIKHIPLPPEGWRPVAGSMARITGWGTSIPDGGHLMEELQEVDVPIISNDSCQKYYHDWSIATNKFITERMLCAGLADGGKDSCQGDSGGPLVVDGYITGIVSWGNGCARAGFPGVNTNVPTLLPWIKEHTGLP